MKTISLKKGFDIPLIGEAKGEPEKINVGSYAMQPGNFIGMSPIPKIVVAVGEKVKAGDPLFFDKKRPEIFYVAPVSGTISDIRRGEKRSIREVTITPDDTMTYREFPAFDFENAERGELVNYLLKSGVWALMRQRPFDIVPEPSVIPKNIFISTFDTAPLAPDNDIFVKGREDDFQTGLEVLRRLTEGKVHLGLDGNKGSVAAAFLDAKGVEKTYFKGPHPAGNVGVQIHHTAPIDANHPVWVMCVQNVITIGALFNKRRYDAGRIVALTGAELENPKYVKTYIGASIGDLLKGNLDRDNVRIISGDVLSGRQKGKHGFLNICDNQVTVIEEGNDYELFGWLIPSKRLPTVSRTFFNFLLPKKKFNANTNVHGDKRAFVMTGQFEDVLPMDILPQHLFKSILIEDYELMEGLGIYELTEEDVALCEFVDTSKQPIQQILRQGLTMMMEG